MPRRLQSKIHSEKSTVAQIWTDYKQQIIDLWNTSQSKADFNDHLIREFNRKINRFNKSSDLFIKPFDGGYRFIGGPSLSTLSDNLVAHWKFNETSGIRYDSVGNANLEMGSLDETQVGFIQGIIGDAADFNDSTYLIGDYTSPLVGRQASFSVWIKTTINSDFYSYSDYSFLVLFTDSVALYITGDGHLAGNASAGGGAEECRCRSTIAINDGQWHHVVITSDGNIQKMYIDGVLNTTGGRNLDNGGPYDGEPPPSPTIVDQSQVFEELPRYAVLINSTLDEGGGVQEFGVSPSSYDSISLWNRNLTAEEVTKLYNNGEGLDLESFNV